MKVTVNGDIIPEEAIEFELSRLVRFYAEHMPEDQIRTQLPIIRKRAVDQAIGAKLLIEEAQRLDIQVSGDEIDLGVEEMKKQAGGDATFLQAMSEQGITEQELRASIQRGKRVDKLVATITEGSSDPTEEEIQTHFEAHKGEYEQSEQASAQHILIKPENETPEALETARDKLNEIRARIAESGKFAEEASEHSECPSGRQASGSLGWFGRGMMVKAFDDVVFSMNVGELSELVQTEFGFHVILKTGEKEQEAADYDSTRDKIRDFLRHAARGEAVSARVNDLREKATIEITEDDEAAPAK